MPSKTDNRTLLVNTKKEELRVTIPADYKVTFGPVQPGSRGYGDEGNCLRIYESETKQRAVFVNVVSFRDLSIPVERRVKRTKEKQKREYDADGNLKENSEVAVDAGDWEEA